MCENTANKSLYRHVAAVRETVTLTDWMKPTILKPADICNGQLWGKAQVFTLIPNRDVKFGIHLGQIGPKWDKSGTF